MRLVKRRFLMALMLQVVLLLQLALLLQLVVLLQLLWVVMHGSHVKLLLDRRKHMLLLRLVLL